MLLIIVFAIATMVIFDLIKSWIKGDSEKEVFNLANVDWERAISDERTFEQVKLSNDLNVLMLSKPDTDISVVALAV